MFQNFEKLKVLSELSIALGLMDVKASARAKHALSQRGRARHSSRKHQPQQQQQQSATDSQQPQTKEDLHLPSNWSRYEEEEEEDERLFDVPPVKSKGANYRDLLAEKSLLQGPDLSIGRKQLMVTRGLDLWSRLTNRENLWSIHNVSGDEDNFFSLDLDFLNEELSKLDIAERLLLDPKLIPLEELEKYESILNSQGAKVAEVDKASLASTSRIKEDSNFTKSRVLISPEENTRSPVSISPEETDFLQSNPLAGNKEVGKGALDTREVGAALKLVPNKDSEFHDSDGPSVSKEPLAQPPNATSLFDVKSAEAELDALLDMLDNKSTGETQSSVPIMFHDADSRPVLVFEGSCHDGLQEEKITLDIRVQTSHVATLNSNVGTANDTSLPTMESPKVAGNVVSTPSHGPVVDSIRTVPNLNLDEDFDNWLDSL